MRFDSLRWYNNPLARRAHRSEMRRFLSALFQPHDLIEIRAIANRREDASPGSAIKARMFARPWNLAQRFDELTSLNQSGVNVYFGVNPRTARDGRKTGVQQCRSVWVDMDHITVKDAWQRITAVMPEPSLMVDSGHGVHVYYLLDKPVNVSDKTIRDNFEDTLRGFYRAIGADSTQDVTRLLRLPGFLNVKGDQIPCRLERFSPRSRFSLQDFARFKPIRRHTQTRAVPATSAFSPQHSIESVRQAVGRLDEGVGDRSRRDFAVICHLLRLGLPVEEIWTLVEGKSKFATAGRRYFDHTVTNALRRLAGA